MKGGPVIDVKRAIKLYNHWKDWRIVAEKMPRADGTLFQPASIIGAVWRHDNGKA